MMKRPRNVLTFLAVFGLILTLQAGRSFAGARMGNPQGRSAKSGSDEDQHYLTLFKKASAGDAEAFSTLKADAAKGNPTAEYALGSLFEQGGKGVPINADAAMLWIGRSARAGYLFAQEYYGLMYATGKLGKKDFKKARHWFQVAANRGSVSAQENLARMDENGWGGPVDLPGATHLYELAAARGDSSGKSHLIALADSEWGRQELVVGPILFRLGMNRDDVTAGLPASWSLGRGKSGWFMVSKGGENWSGALRFRHDKVVMIVSNLAGANDALTQTYLHAAVPKGGCKFELARRIGHKMAVTDMRCPRVSVFMSGKPAAEMPQCNMLVMAASSRSLDALFEPTLWKTCGPASIPNSSK